MQSEQCVRERFAFIARDALKNHITDGCWQFTWHANQASNFFHCLAAVLQFERYDHEPLPAYLKRAAALG
jgi:hypothetical protein